MSDLERRLHDVLVSAADEAPAANGLAERVRRRARGRRRTLMVAAAGVAVAAIAVPSALALGGDDPSTGPVIHDTAPPVTSPTVAVPDGWRIETWRDLEIRVPDDWGYGDLSSWCAAGGSLDDRVVERPGGVVTPIACKAPQSGYGVQFFDPAAYDPAYAAGQVRRIAEHGPFPAGSWVGFQYAGRSATADAAVLVVAPSQEVALEVLGSVRLVEDADSNGCPVRDTPTEGPGDGSLSVCRYTVAGDLEQSERLLGADATAVLAAVDRAPVTTYAPPCPGAVGGDGAVTSYVVLLAGDTRMQVVWEGSRCAAWGVFIDDRERRELTRDVMYWALSPGWSGGVSGGVPLPPELRQR